MSGRCGDFVLPGRVVGLTVLLFVTGCGSRGVEPPGDGSSARTTLAAVLDAWKEGKLQTDIQSATPAVYAADPDWSAGRRLADYQIAEEPVPNGGEWRVYATLTLGGGESGKPPQKVCYSVSPGDPANVSRSDYLY